MSDNLYTRKALLGRIVDADTIDATIYLPYGLTINKRIRFYGIDTYEVRGDYSARGKEAAEALALLFAKYGPYFYFRSYRDRMGVYDRAEGEPYLTVPTGHLDVIATLKARGFDRTMANWDTANRRAEIILPIADIADLHRVKPLAVGAEPFSGFETR